MLGPGLGLIFDLDGVIVDSMPMHEQAWREHLQGIAENADEIIAQMHGRRNDEIFRDLIGLKDEAEIFAHGARKEETYRRMMGPRLKEFLVPGVAEFLARTSHLPVGLASNAEPANVDFMLQQSGLEKYFSVVVDGSQVDKPKPDPEIYLKAAREMGLEPRNAIVFEDSPTGVTAARKAGMRVVGILTAKTTLNNIDLAVADFRRPELETWLNAQRAI
jgi:beta-phosphoglucomutase